MEYAVFTFWGQADFTDTLNSLERLWAETALHIKVFAAQVGSDRIEKDSGSIFVK